MCAHDNIRVKTTVQIKVDRFVISKLSYKDMAGWPRLAVLGLPGSQRDRKFTQFQTFKTSCDFVTPIAEATTGATLSQGPRGHSIFDAMVTGRPHSYKRNWPRCCSPRSEALTFMESISYFNSNSVGSTDASVSNRLRSVFRRC